jgi:hypothetical protein
MKTLKHVEHAPPMALSARRAADLMTPNPMSIRQSVTVSEAATFLAGRGISAAPVIDEAGRPVGVVSSTDILIHMGQAALYRVGSPERDARPEPPALSGDGPRAEAPNRSPVARCHDPRGLLRPARDACHQGGREDAGPEGPAPLRCGRRRRPRRGHQRHRRAGQTPKLWSP